jgi:uncharacterized protein DUF5655/uncharacterized protein DUF4287
MATAEEGIQAQIHNIEATYGKSMSQWLAVIAARGLTKHNEVVSMLKADYGMTHGAAHRVSLVSRQASAPPAASCDPADPAGALYTGKKTALRPLHDALMTAITAFGDDVQLAPKKGYVSLRRRKQFAMLQPSGAGRVDVGLILPGEPAEGRLEPAAGFNALFTHRVRVSSAAEIDTELTAWHTTGHDPTKARPDAPRHRRALQATRPVTAPNVASSTSSASNCPFRPRRGGRVRAGADRHLTARHRLCGVADGDGQAGQPPFGHPAVQPSCGAAAGAQLADGVVGEHAVRAAAVGGDLGSGGQLGKPLAELGDRDGYGARDVPGSVFGCRSHIEDGDLACACAAEEFVSGDLLDVLPQVGAAGGLDVG